MLRSPLKQVMITESSGASAGMSIQYIALASRRCQDIPEGS
jgi:hypothetical protein